MRADFHVIDRQARLCEQPLLAACELVRRACADGLAGLVYVRDSSEADALDDLLWSFDEDAFIPHQLAGDDDDAEVAVLIVTPDLDVDTRPWVLNLREAPVHEAFEQVLELVTPDAAQRQASRLRWRAYQQAGREVTKHDW